MVNDESKFEQRVQTCVEEIKKRNQELEMGFDNFNKAMRVSVLSKAEIRGFKTSKTGQ